MYWNALLERWPLEQTGMTVLMMLVVAVWSAASAATQTVPRAVVALDNARVRAYRTTIGAVAGVAHGPGVVIWLRDGPGGQAGRAMWLDDVAVPPATGQSGEAIVIVQPLAQPAPRSSPPSGSKPGDAPFTGMPAGIAVTNRVVYRMRPPTHTLPVCSTTTGRSRNAPYRRAA